MKKWHTVLWLVFISMAIGSGISFVWRTPGDKGEKVGTVNGQKITVDQYKHALVDLQNFLQRLGFAGEMFFKNINTEELAFDICVKEKLLDTIKDDLHISISDRLLKEMIIKTMPEEVTDETGRINMEAYRNYVSRLSLTPGEFENRKEAEFKRQLINRFAEITEYTPLYMMRFQFDTSNARKSFVIAELSFDRILQEIEKAPLVEQELKDFYEKHKETYRIPEKRRALYWTISQEGYAQKIDIDQSIIQQYYDRNKSRLYRIAPKVKVRNLLVKIPTQATQSEKDALFKKAQEIAKQAKAQPDQFIALIKKFSQDETTVKESGLIDFFSRGTHDAAFEKEAFKLQTAGALSDVVTTAKGYEIIQLVARISASEKPLETVKDEIIKTLKTKKMTTGLRGELETMLHGARVDDSLFDQYVKQQKLEAKETEWLSPQGSGSGHEGLMDTLAQRIFSQSQRQSSYGYVVVDNNYVLYKRTGVSKSFIPTFEQVKQDVTKQYQNNKSEKMMRDLITKTRSDVLTKKTPLFDAAQKVNMRIIKTGLIKKGAEIEGIERGNELAQKMFDLTDGSQLLRHAHKKNEYLVQVIGYEKASPADFEQEKGKLLDQERNKQRGGAVNGFIASLHRTAKIEVSQGVLNSRKMK